VAVVVLVTAVAGGFYLLIQPEEAGETAWLAPGHDFAPSRLDTITKALDRAQIDWIVDQGRVGVPRASHAEVQRILARQNLAPPSVPDMLDQEPQQSLFAPHTQVQDRRDRQKARFLAAAIEDVDPSLTASVIFHRPKTDRLKPAGGLRVSVWLKVKGDRRIPPGQVESIAQLLLSLEPELHADRLSVVDRKGRTYLNPADPALGHQSRLGAREEELAGKIYEQLDHIKGIRVAVSIDPAGPPAAPAAPAAPVAEIKANEPIEPDGGTPRSTAGMPAAPMGKASILVQIPARHVFERFRVVVPDVRPTPQALEPFFAEARADVDRAVRTVVPPSEFGRLEVTKIGLTDPLAPSQPVTANQGRLAPFWWSAAAGGVLAATIAMTVALWVSARRIPKGRSAARRPGGPAGQGPSERVRELVRLDPDAAAGVLRRWTVEGGHET
jgi:hypothetical protein